MLRYIGTYRVFPATLLDGTVSPNREDVYLLGRYKIQVYRYDKKQLAILFNSGQTVNNIIPQLKELGIKLDLYIEGDTESVYLFNEKELEKIHSVVRFQTKGKNIQAKSVRTARRLQKKNTNC